MRLPAASLHGVTCLNLHALQVSLLALPASSPSPNPTTTHPQTARDDQPLLTDMCPYSENLIFMRAGGQDGRRRFTSVGRTNHADIEFKRGHDGVLFQDSVTLSRDSRGPHSEGRNSQVELLSWTANTTTTTNTCFKPTVALPAHVSQ